MSEFQVWVRTSGDGDKWSSNGVKFERVADAKDAGARIFDRWFAVENWAVMPVDEIFVGHIPTVQVRIHSEFMQEME